jgi:hypothetical protein
MVLNLREAAEQAGVGKSSIWRAIKSGKLSATRTEDGNVQIDPAELARAFPPKPPKPDKPPTGEAGTAVRNAALEVEVRLLREMLEDMRRDRDTWRGQAERAQLAAPIIAAASPANQVVPIVPPAPAPRLSWWRWLRQAS